MNLEVITIGTELLLGFTTDTNGGEIGQALAAIGVQVVRRTSIPDQPAAIETAVREALRRTGAVITTGGLGPTRDDITKKIVAGIFGQPLEFQESLWAMLLERYARYGRAPAASNRCQAEVPRGATVLPNQWGTAPGLLLESDLGMVIMLPGVPNEMRGLLRHEVVPRLAAKGEGRVVVSRTFRSTSIPESSLAELLGDIETDIAPLTLAYLPGLEGVDVRITAWSLPPAEAAQAMQRAGEIIHQRAGRWLYGEGEDDLAALLLDAARAGGQTLAVAESCTGGMIGERITAVPGSSEVFLGGVIAYHNHIKVSELGVDPALLQAHGAVSEAVVRAMAEGVARRMGATLAIAITGIAGPGGATDDKPVGLVWYATYLNGSIKATKYVFPGDRENIRYRSAQAAMFQLYQAIE